MRFIFTFDQIDNFIDYTTNSYYIPTTLICYIDNVELRNGFIINIAGRCNYGIF